MKGTTELYVGLLGNAELIVAEQHTASAMGSGRMPVLATPAMVALMEAAALNAVDKLLTSGYQTVGTRLDVYHYSSTPIGMRALAIAELTAVEGRTLTFQLVVHDDKELIGEGLHVRTITSLASFNRLLQQKIRRAPVKMPNT